MCLRLAAYEIIVFILFLYIFLAVLISYQQDQDITNNINNPLDDLIL